MQLRIKAKSWDFWNDLGKIKSIFIGEVNGDYCVTAILDISNIDKRLYDVYLGTGIMYQIDQEYLFTFGGRATTGFVKLRLEDEMNYFNIEGEYIAASGIPFPLDEIDVLDLEFIRR